MLAHLTDRGVVGITGPDAAGLLQNVLTLDVAAVDRHGSGYGALLTPQGKILWDFILHRREGGYAADLRADQAEAFAKRLTLYKLRAKVEIGVRPGAALYAAWQAGERDEAGTDAARSGAPADPRLAGLGTRWIADAQTVSADATAADWHAHRIALAIPEGGVDFVFGDTFPHDAAMDSLNGVAFDKGCYIGQEVVSRMRHRGTARRRIVALRAAGEPPGPGADIVAGEQPVGRLGSSADGSAIGLVRLDRVRSALDRGAAIRAGDATLSVTLPAWATYDWPSATASSEA